ncbi:hypothetical protein BAE44_0008354 [Dichanthelium oligosanthes]|uniref:F-box domain-containing protein n=1 Tax=Dichanthelium oligosanthes TaxID=888268 RepID=A0A1E5VZU6_9POAL|nr:hypothetical protein BAE44_0008354 [Dichanthelium oligosanthes]
MADQLPDVLARLHLSPRSLAVSRCVCRAWRATVDGLGLLRADLLPLSVGGIFVNLRHGSAPPEFFVPPSTARRIAGKLESFVEMEHLCDIPNVENCCNSLLLDRGHVVNPGSPTWHDAYLAFDPAVSPHYTVLLNHRHCWYDKNILEGSEWPPSPYTMCVFSSRTGRWEERLFVREGGPAGTIADVRSAPEPDYGHDVYYQGALYVHCRREVILLCGRQLDPLSYCNLFYF